MIIPLPLFVNGIFKFIPRTVGCFLRLYYFFQTDHLSHYILSRVQVVFALPLTLQCRTVTSKDA